MRARVARAWVDYIVDTKMTRGTRWVLGGGSKKRAFIGAREAAGADSEFFVRVEAEFALWEMLVRDRQLPEATTIAQQAGARLPRESQAGELSQDRAGCEPLTSLRSLRSTSPAVLTIPYGHYDPGKVCNRIHHAARIRAILRVAMPNNTTAKAPKKRDSTQSWVGFVCRDCGAPLALHRSNNGSRPGERSLRGWRITLPELRRARLLRARHRHGAHHRHINRFQVPRSRSAFEPELGTRAVFTCTSVFFYRATRRDGSCHRFSFVRPRADTHVYVGRPCGADKDKSAPPVAIPLPNSRPRADVGAPCAETIRRPAGRVRTSSVPAGRQTDRFGALAVRTFAPPMIKSG